MNLEEQTLRGEGISSFTWSIQEGILADLAQIIRSTRNSSFGGVNHSWLFVPACHPLILSHRVLCATAAAVRDLGVPDSISAIANRIICTQVEKRRRGWAGRVWWCSISVIIVLLYLEDYLSRIAETRPRNKTKSFIVPETHVETPKMKKT